MARALSYLCAATSTWALNRIWTFKSADRSLLRQWATFLSANAFGGLINYATSAGCALLFPALVTRMPVLALAAGALAGLGANYMLSKRYVFRA